MRIDNELQQDVLEELRDDPSVEASQIGVSANQGVVTLSGSVPSYAEKHAAEQAAKRVYGTKAVANEIDVNLPYGSQRTDAEIARTALDTLQWDALVPEEHIQVTVEKGWVTLDGTVDSPAQKSEAETLVRRLKAVTGVTNSIRVRAKAGEKDVKHRLFEAFRRNAELEARRIGVEVHHGKVRLHGSVRDWSEIDEAVRAASSVPGVVEIENELVIVP